jgi:tetraacyldisaccharide 4'-kinase
LKAPEFWRRHDVDHDVRQNLAARVLAPLGVFTRVVTALRMRQAGFSPGVPVICVGNASVGGSGKTIVALDILRRLPGHPFALTRGYGGRLAGPVLVDPAVHTAAEVGDEALLLAQAAPVVVARDRAAGARLAVRLGAGSIVMDDGLQNPALAKTLSLLVVDGGAGFGNGFLLPAGPLREPVVAAAARCQAAVLIGADVTQVAQALPGSLPVLRARLAPDCAVALRERKVLAFAGIGRPEKFFDSVAALGAVIAGAEEFADHHVYRAVDEARLQAAAQRLGAVLVTTAKDFVKLSDAMKANVIEVTVRLVWEDEAALMRLLA